MNSAPDFARDGYCILPAAFTPDEVALMREDADFILHLILNSSVANERQSRRLDIRKRKAGGIVVRKIQPVLDLAPAIAQLASDDRLLGPLTEFMADEPVLFEEKLNYKQPLPEPVATAPEMHRFQTPADDDRFPIHNDYAYYKHNDYPPEVISTAIAIDDCREGNGPMLVFPGTHTQHVEHLRVRNGLEVPEGTVNRTEAKPIVAPAGSLIFFHSRLIHTSNPNPTNAPRRLLIFSHFPKSAAIPFDIRNGPNRLRESPWEWRYQRLKNAGYRDPFPIGDLTHPLSAEPPDGVLEFRAHDTRSATWRSKSEPIKMPPTS